MDLSVIFPAYNEVYYTIICIVVILSVNYMIYNHQENRIITTLESTLTFLQDWTAYRSWSFEVGFLTSY